MGREDESMPSALGRNACFCSVGGHLRKNGLQSHNGLGRETLEELLNTVAEEKQLEDSGCDRVNRTWRLMYFLGKIMSILSVN